MFRNKQSHCVIQHSITGYLTVYGHVCDNLKTCAVLADGKVQVHVLASYKMMCSNLGA